MSDLLTVTDELLDEMFSHEVGCESAHKRSDNPACSVAVTHKLSTGCGTTKLLCANAATSSARLIATSRNNCETCHTPTRSCWSVIPV